MSATNATTSSASQSNLFLRIAEILPQRTFFLATQGGFPETRSSDELREVFDRLLPEQRMEALHLRFELAQREDPSVYGDEWPEEHFWDDTRKATQVMHRMGLLGNESLVEISYNLEITHQITLTATPARPESFHYSMGHKLGKDPEGGWISYVNGLGNSTQHAGTDANIMSDALADGHNIHGIYLPTQQVSMLGDQVGFHLDFIRYMLVDSGGRTRTSCMIAQQWIDYLDENPGKNFLQTCHSEGAAHVDAALQIIRDTRADIIERLNVLAFCPARFIFPKEGEPLKVMNLLKLLDPVPTGWATGKEQIHQECPHIQIVAHEDDGVPHCHTTPDYFNAGKPYFDRFISTGSMFPKDQ
ncbi:MAG: hypothetical protein V4492_04120 [Chlamydiota bacterium]